MIWWVISIGVGVAFDGMFQYHLGAKSWALVAGMGWLTAAVGFAVVHDVPSAVMSAVCGAVWLHRWWNGGGGRGLRRRLKRIFQGVRRVAPAPT